MPRPTRIEYEHVFYHAMNRSHGRGVVFHSPDDYRAFLDALKEAHERFDAVIHVADTNCCRRGSFERGSLVLINRC